MDFHRCCAVNDYKEPLNIREVKEVVRDITKLSLNPKDNEVRQIELLTKLDYFISSDGNGNLVIDRVLHEDDGCLRALLHMIHICHYPHVVLRALSLIHKCLNQKRNVKGSSTRRMSLTHVHDDWTILLNVLYNTDSNLQFANCPSVVDNAYYYLLSIISNLCKRDKNFWKLFEDPCVIQKLFYLLTKYNRSFKMSITILTVLKSILKSRNTVVATSCRPFFECLETIFVMLKKKKSNKIKLIPIIIKLLSKYDSVHDSIFETKLPQQLLSLLANDDNLPVTYSVCRTVLFAINKIIKKESSFKLFKSNANVRSLYRFCSHFPATEDKHYSLLLKACSIIHACIEKRELPIDITNCYEHSKHLISDADNNYIYSDKSDIEEEDEEEEGEYDSDSDKSDEYELSEDDISDDFQGFERMDYHCTSRVPPLNINKCSEKLTEDRYEPFAMYDNIDRHLSHEKVYCALAKKVITKRQLVNIPYPDMIGAQSRNVPHLLTSNYTKFSRSKLIEILDSTLNEKVQSSQVVFDLDELQKSDDQSNTPLKCNDLEKLVKSSKDSRTLQFESRFEGGNLRKAVKVSQFVYNLILAPDVNVKSRYQWFYFQISNMKAQVPYIFNIINCDKSNSQYNHGMQPVMFSVKEAVLGRTGWFRSGSDICYFRNNFVDRTQPTSIYHTLSLTVRFLHNSDVCYLAYHYPYTYSRLTTFLHELQISLLSNPSSEPPIYRIDTLCHTPAGNAVPLVTITAPSSEEHPVKSRRIVVLTSRVHPAESNASWAMEGTLRYLLQDCDATCQLRQMYVFKVIPMQNPEGVIYGSYRYGLTAEDLNRCWRNPDIIRHPEIFHVKALIQALKERHGKNVSLFIDYHGHSRKRNFFLYGCSYKHSWNKKDRRMIERTEECLNFPTVLSDISKSFSLASCKFNIEKSRETTGRVSVWREFGIKRSYTVECTYCGFDIGPYKSQSINTAHLFEIGASLMRGLWAISNEEANTLNTANSQKAAASTTNKANAANTAMRG